ncbi:MAG: ATP-binding cassette domain-containing protein, partial [Ktedonobacteraceae bacterium]
MAIQDAETTNLVTDIVIDRTKDAVVIDGVSKIFKKQRSWLSRFKKKNAQKPETEQSEGEKKEEKREVRAVDDVSMTVKYREIMGILWANGSGKSTLIRMLSTLLIPDAGTVSIFGYDVEKDERTVQRLI